MEEKKKSLPRDNDTGARISFAVHLLIVVPIFLFVLLPLTIFWNLVAWPFKKKPTPHQYQPIKDAVEGDLKAFKDRKYDLVLFGVTGFTGRLAAKYVAKTYGSKISWAIAGRRQAELEKVRSEIAGIDSSLASLNIILADSFDTPSLRKLVSDTRAIATTVGPYHRYGTPLVEMCAFHGTSYCDITGETDWVRESIDRFDDVARSTNARIVHLCGHDSVPWDLSVFGLAEALKENKEELIRTECFDEINGNVSGGTLETMFSLAGGAYRYRSASAVDPLLKTADGKKSASGLAVANQKILGFSNTIKSWVGPFVMASVNSNTVRRSNALNQYSGAGRLTYAEAQVYPSFIRGFPNFVQILLLIPVLFLPPFTWFVRKYVLPAPGAGPSEAAMDHGFLTVTAFGTGSKMTRLKSVMHFDTDPGYRDTARMLVESALALSLDADKIQVGGGVFTPAACQGQVLLDRLKATGTSFTLEKLA